MDFDRNWDVQTIKGDYLKGRTALVTGATRGIGFAIARLILENNGSVVLTGSSVEKVQAAKEKLIPFVREDNIVDGIVMNNLKVELFEECFQKALTLIGERHFDILVNNAGINGSGRFGQMTPEIFDEVIGVNLRGTYFISQMFANYMVKNHYKGNILNIASSSSLRPAVTPYTLSKWGVRGLTVGLAKTLQQYGIIVNAVAPGPTATSMMAVNGYNGTSLDFGDVPSGRFITQEEIANAAVFLISDMGKMVVGDVLYVTGGPGITTTDDLKYDMPEI